MSVTEEEIEASRIERIAHIKDRMLGSSDALGKTTALLQSGLRFPLEGLQELKGVGGTRHCDWFFTDEAVLIDTAGRWTTQDSDRAADARPADETVETQEQDTALLLTLPQGLDWRMQPFSHVGGPGSRPMRVPVLRPRTQAQTRQAA